MSENLISRIADLLGWTPEQVRQFSLPTLREMVRVRSPKLANEITQFMQGSEYYFEKVPTRRRTMRNSGGFRWGKTDWSQGPLKTPAQVRALAKRLRAKRSPRAHDAASFAERYSDSILAQPKLQRDLLETERTSTNPRRRAKVVRLSKADEEKLGQRFGPPSQWGKQKGRLQRFSSLIRLGKSAARWKGVVDWKHIEMPGETYEGHATLSGPEKAVAEILREAGIQNNPRRRTMRRNSPFVDLTGPWMKSPEFHCDKGDVYIEKGDDGKYYVGSWDGKEAWHVGGPYRTKREAIQDARESERQWGKRNPRRRTMRIRVKHRRRNMRRGRRRNLPLKKVHAGKAWTKKAFCTRYGTRKRLGSKLKAGRFWERLREARHGAVRLRQLNKRRRKSRRGRGRRIRANRRRGGFRRRR